MRYELESQIRWSTIAEGAVMVMAAYQVQSVSPHAYYASWYRKLSWGCAWACAGLTLLCMGTSIAMAQQKDGQSIPLGKALGGMVQTKLTLSPSLVTIDLHTKTATIEFLNETMDTLESDIEITTDAPLRLNPKRLSRDSTKSKQASSGLLGALLNDDESKSANAEIPQTRSLVPWLKGIPAHLTLAPGEKKRIEVTVDVPADAKAGEYLCWVVSRSTGPGGVVRETGAFSITGADGKPIRIPSFTKVSLTVGSSPE